MSSETLTPRTRRKSCIGLALLLVLLIGFPAFLAWNFLVGPMLNLQTRLRSVIGKTRSEAISELGPPDLVDGTGEGETLVYRSATTQALVRLGKDGRVTRVDFGDRPTEKPNR